MKKKSLRENNKAKLTKLEKELAEKKRELNIETSLEKVRIKALRMKRPSDMLEICKTISRQLESLGVNEIRNVQTAIFYQERGTYMNFEYYAKHNKTILTETLYTNHKMHKEFARKMLKGKGEFFKTHINGKKVKDWIAYQKTTNVFIDKYLETASSVNYYWFSLGPVALGISTYHPLTEEEIDLFKRFLKVFELAYRRYLDIEKAEAQAREARIEASLERVRAQAMGMNRPEDILSIGNVLFDELKRLGFNKIRNTLISIFNDKEGFFKDYDYSDYFGGSITKIFYNSHPIIEEFMVQIKKADDAFAEIVVDRKQIKGWEEFRKRIGEKPDPRLKNINFLYYYIYSIGSGSIGISNFEKINDEQREILKRFRNVFDLAYRRYNDITLAEAQAKEAKIEAALEKVRAVAMSMNKPDDLLNICEILFKELHTLEFRDFRNTMINIHNDEKGFLLNYDYSDVIGKSIIQYDYNVHPVVEYEMKQLRSAKDAFSEIAITGKELEDWKELRKRMGEKDDPRLDNASALYYYFYSVGTASIGISTTHSINQENHDILSRFRNVFDLAYRRYNDIALAEAQAKEARIETSLEKVRAAAMSMHKSEDLLNVSEILYVELYKLGFNEMRNAMINIHNDENKTFLNYDYSNVIGKSVTLLNFNSHPVMEKQINQSRLANDAFSEAVYKGKDLEEWKKFRRKYGEKDDPRIDKIKALYYYFYSIGSGTIGISTFSPINEEKLALIKRFRNVFSLSYQRYSDIALAEAQAREAQIELALERIRSRTMAMHKSDELSETAYVLFEQFRELGENPDQLSIGTVNDVERSLELWLTVRGNKFDRVFKVPINEPIVINKIYNAWKEKNKSFVLDVSGDELKKYNSFRNNIPDFKDYNKVKNSGIKEEQRRVIYCAFFKRGLLSLATPEPRPEETIKLLERFAGVFDLTYTRFLDLQKAETQAKEAEIELALERVRARTMAMQKSDELKEVIRLVYEQFVHLKINVDHAGFVVDYSPKGDWHFWIADEQDIPSKITHPYFESVWASQFNEAKEKGADFFATNLNFEEKNKFYNELLLYVPGLPEASKDFYLNCPGLAATTVLFDNVSLYIENFSGISYSDEENIILKRFGKVFRQTYTRFLDLQKAEEQAREAQIETALERVRAGSMAMHKSDELLDVISVVSTQLENLGFRFDIVSFAANNKEFDYNFWLTVKGQRHPYRIYVPYIDNPMFERVKKAQLEGQPFYTDVLSKEENKQWHQHLFKHNKLDFVTETLKKYVFNSGYARSIALLPNIMLIIGNYSAQPYSDEENNIIKRFANVFDQAYRRFLDLQKAEAQAKESQIQLGLERVRARTMAMHKSDELSETSFVLFKQLEDLGEVAEQISILIYNEKDKVIELYATIYGNQWEQTGRLPIAESKVHKKIYAAWKEKKKSIVIDLLGEDLNDFNNFKMKYSNQYKSEDELPQNRWVIHNTFFSKGLLSFSTHEPRPLETIKLLERFAAVFDMTYTRFLDLKTAEAQMREAQIEAALERVRAKAMAMHSSNDLSDTMGVLFTELPKLGINSLRCGVVLLSKNSTQGVFYAAATTQESDSFTMIGGGDMKKHPVFLRQYESWSRKENYFVTLSGEELASYYKEIFARVSKTYNPREHKLQTEHGYYFSFSEGMFYAWSEEPYSEESINILNRFKSIIDLTFRRYLDLQKAEAQAREAQIEAALERVRAKAMAMHSSKDLADTIGGFYTELKSLGVIPRRCGVALVNKETRIAEVSTMNTTEEGDSVGVIGKINMEGHPILENIYNNWLLQKDYYTVLRGNQIKEYYQILKPQITYPDYPNDVVQYGYYFMFKEGDVYAWTDKELTEEELKIFRRFTTVISLTYKRYIDLQQAETQAREAQIEAALERVRGKAMAMHSSEDFVATIVAFYHELAQLSFTPRRCGVGLINKETRIAELSTLNTTDKGDSIELIGKIKLEGHPVLENVYDNWLTKNEYHPVLKGNEIKEYYQFIGPKIAIPDYSGDQIQYGYFFYFKEGGVYSWTEKEFSDDELQIYRRFTTVLSLTYRRYLDLKEAEARAIESIRQASLDRIRAEIASMRTSEDLNRITPVIWRELKNLEVPFFRCGVYIVDEKTETVRVYLTTPEGKSLGVLNLTFDSSKVTSDTVDHWRKKQIYKQHWTKEEFINWTKSLIEIGQVQSAEIYQGSSEPPESLDLHFVPFPQGMLYVGDVNPLTAEKLQLVKTLAEAFSIAYARYEDFKNLEEAKNKIEVTLNELKSAQAQLIHSEKMASLGELTAGIAHEIKNPLNFVNNFSEVSRELLDEMKVELQNNKIEDVIELVENLKQNLDKINQHGKRADSIVKGMLLHSRGTSGEKTPTDINDLLDQYVNLAYHGMRAQNKEFNITIEKDYDKSLEKINVVPQDISRVFLNIFNNACYAAYDKKKKKGNDFFPTLKVVSKNLYDKVEIRISDNGDGISESIKKQIFNPFFTTKPTGEGTGLGLSLSYDIVTKVHGGDIKVESEEGKGAEFIIHLPLQ